MKAFFRWMLGLALVLVVLGTLAVFGVLHWVSEQEAVRVLVDGHVVDLSLPQGWSLVGLLAVVALSLMLLVFLVPSLIVLALVIGLLGTLLGGVFALLPLLLVGGLIYWLVKRSTRP